MPVGATPLPIDIVAGDTGHVGHHNRAHEAFDAAIWSNVVNVMHADYGAVDGGDPEVNTDALNLARADIAATGKPGGVYIPAGVDLPVVPDDVLGAGDLAYLGGGTLSTIQTTAGALITFPAGSKNFSVAGLRFVGGSDLIVAVKIISEPGEISEDGVIRDNVCVECTLVLTNDDDLAITYADHDTDPVTGNVTRNIDVINNRGTRSAPNLGRKAFILFWYTIGGTIHGNTADGYPYGIQWWGGDADQDVDGDPDNERKCGDFTITANRISNVLDSIGGGAGIWGSMAFSVTVTGGNIVENIADVGIDFEGSVDCTATGNIIINCANGCLTTFFWCKAIHFGPNIVRQDTPGALIARVQNDHPTPVETEDVTFDGGTWTSRGGGIAYIALETAQRVVIRGITARNVRISGEVNNLRNVTVDGCSMLFDVVAGAAFDAIHLGRLHIGGRAIITGNTIESTVTQPAGSHAIDTYQDDPDTDVLEWIDDNRCLGWTTPIHVEWNGANAAHVVTSFIRRNTVDVGATITHTRGAASIATGEAATINAEGNYHADGTSVAVT